MPFSSGPRAPNQLTVAIAAAATFALACTAVTGLFGDAGTGLRQSPAAEPEDPNRLQAQCEREGYPCSYAEASPQALDRSRQLLSLASEVIEQGGTIEEASEYLRGQREVVDVIHDRLALRFRAEGGPEMWLIDPAVMEGTSVETAHIGELARPVSGDDGPVGDQDEGEEPEHRALILAPFFWDFETNEGGKVSQILGRHRNYTCAECRDYLFTAADDIDQDGDGEVDDNPDFGVTLADFQAWDPYEIIHISTHGAQICRDELNFTPADYTPPATSDCYTALFTGNSLSEEAFEKVEDAPGFDIEGVIWARHPDKPECHTASGGKNLSAEGCIEAGRFWQALTADFFQLGYPGGLDEKLIFLSACESMKGTDLSSALAGDNTTVLGWTEAVDADISARVVERFYGFYIEDNLRPEPAYVETKATMANDEQLTRVRPKGGGSFSGAAPEIIRGGSPDPHGREVISILHPIFQEELREKGSMLVQGIPGDGEADKMLFQAQLDGIDESQEAASFVVRMNVDGNRVQESYRPTSQISEYSYQTDVLEVPLGFDVSGTEIVELDAWVELPEGGVSRHVVEEVKLASCGWTGVMSGTRSGGLSGDLVLNLADFADVDPEVWVQLGFGESGPPDIGTVASAPDTLMLTGHPPYPALMVNDVGFAMAIFSGPGDAVFGLEPQTALQFGRREADYFDGSFQAPMVDAINQGNVTLTVDFVWNAGSICDIELIAAAGEIAPDEAAPP